MNIALSPCFVQVHDPDAALGFYRDALGLEVRNDVAYNGSRWVTVGSPDQPEISIVLTDYVDGAPQDKEVVAALLAKGAMNGVHFSTADLEGLFDKVRAAGAEVVEEPTDQPWGVRDGAVRDPSGNLIRINQTVPA